MEGSRKINVLMLPWVAHGHLSGFLELAKRLSNRNFSIHLCSSPANLTSIKGKIGKEFADTIQLVELHIPSLPDLPPQFHTTNGLPPKLMPLLHQAFDMAEPSFAAIVKELKPDLLIHDYVPSWAPAIAKANNLPAVEYVTTSATFMAYSLHIVKKPDVEFPYPSVSYPDGHPFLRFLTNDSPNGLNKVVMDCLDNSSGLLLSKTFPEIEREYMDYFASLVNKKVLPVAIVEESNPDQGEKSEIIEWLDKKEKNSTLFVSFGSELFFPETEIEEVALGLEVSGVNFIWVVRFPTGKTITLKEFLPEGYLERVEGRGLVVEGWAPQRQILAHSSIGGFVSHCGWNSMMENFKLGVPVIAAPKLVDQPINARLVKAAGVGVEIEMDDQWRLQRGKIAEAIKQVVTEESGEKLRRKARELSNALIKKGEEDIDLVASELVRLCRV